MPYTYAFSVGCDIGGTNCKAGLIDSFVELGHVTLEVRGYRCV